MKSRARCIALLGCATLLNLYVAGMSIYFSARAPREVRGRVVLIDSLYIARAVVSVLAVIGTLRGWRGAIVLKAVSMVWAGLWCLVTLAGVFHLTA
jgi:hypothetical protein